MERVSQVKTVNPGWFKSGSRQSKRQSPEQAPDADESNSELGQNAAYDTVDEHGKRRPPHIDEYA